MSTGPWPVRATTDSVEATRELAGRLAPLCRAGDMVLLVGDLGAGKTAFAQGFAAALGVEGPVTSPTFALVRHYRCGAASPVSLLIHADVYRTGTLAEVVDLALAELVEEDAVALVEWGDLAAPALGESTLEVRLDMAGAGSPTARRVTVVGRGAWAERAGEVAAALEPVGAT
ncbi:MAG TPA: tRNA (adenosine(37)-N6)-threonylcarbamoyltransferase complex ATPase subunit type 1 TsaE [Acidimicrobiales bacterium]|nr:tRNA (adenosine(37)-N6)-threonylcarbamoyltransferase complex ATPase subunit type 1 TsaE [Acidimicrobiales bacterium]